MGFDVTASDNHPLVKEFLNQNILNNNLSPIKYETGDWNIENPLLGDFDFIIGSDILYEPSHAKLVSAFIDAHSSKSVEVVIVDPNRSNSSKFIAKMDALGYSHEYEPFIYPTDYGVFIRGRILYFHR
jgi:predicted nicotinamide N-methyase